MKRLLFGFFLLLLSQLSAYAVEYPVIFQSPAGHPFFESQEFTIDSEEYNTLVIRIDSKTEGTGRLFWANSYDMRFNQPKSLAFSINPGKRNYYLNISSQNPNWIGWAKKIILMPEFNKENIQIESAKLVSSNLITNIASGWQEFWGPRGRLVIGSSINTLQSPNLFGRAIFVYIYWILFLALGLLVILEIKKSFAKKETTDYLATYINIGKKLVIFIIIIWVALEFSSLISNWNNIKGDFSLIGKDIHQKRMIMNTGDFYPFIQFCKNNIPHNATFNSSIPPFYNDIKATYYLYPIRYDKDGEFLVVYDKEPDNKLLKKHKAWKQFRKGAYILKKK
jgi:hypothetical protein